MKENLLAIGKSMAALCACSILFSLILAALYYFHIVSQSTFHILNWIFGFLAYGFSGILLGIGIKKKALLHAVGVLVIIFIIGLICMDQYSVMNLIEFASKLLAYALGSIAVTLKRNGA